MVESHSILISGIPFTVTADMRWLYPTRDRALSRRHCNAQHEVTIVLRGSCQVDVADSHYTLQTGQAFLVPPGQFHYVQSMPGDFDRFTFRFSLPESAQARSLRSQLPNHRIFRVSPEITRLCTELYALYESKPLYWQELYGVQLPTLLLQILQLLQIDLPSPDQPLLQPHEDTRASRIDRYIEDHLSDSSSIDNLAKHMHLSRRQMVRILQDIYGLGFREKLLFARMDRAAWLLRTTQTPVSEIMERVGYSSPASFHRAFRSYFQTTPLQYRKQSNSDSQQP